MRSTILFVNGRAVRYSMHQEGDRYFLYPRDKFNPPAGVPRLCAYLKGGGWVVEGCDSRNLFNQVVEEITVRFERPISYGALA